MTQHLKLITPITTFQSEPTVNNFLKMVEYLVEEGYEKLDSDTEQILINSDIDIVTEREGQESLSFHEFDLSVWRILERIDTSIDWWKYLEGSEPEKELDANQADQAKPIPSEISLAVRDALHSHDDEVKKNKKSWNGYLYFFNEVNNKIKEKPNFAHCIKLAKELSIYLYQINIDFLRKSHRVYFPDKFWQWFLPKTIDLYKKYYCDNDDFEILIHKKTNQVTQIRLISSCVILCWICQNKNYDANKVQSAFNNLKLENNSFIASHFASDDFLKLVRELLFKPYNERFMMEIGAPILCLLLSVFRSGNFLNHHAYAVLTHSMFDQGWDVSEEFGDDIVRILEALLSGLYPHKGNRFIRGFFDWTILDDPFINQYKKYYQLDGPSIETSFEILNSRNLFSNLVEAYYSDLANDLVIKCNAHLKETGEPFNLGLKLDEIMEFDLYPPFPEYFESISTLPILLGQTDNYLNSIDIRNYSERLVRGAEAIADAGLIKHALVFLGYGLIKTPLGFTYKNDFSIRDLSTFIYRVDVAPYLEKYFFPFMEFYKELESNSSLVAGIPSGVEVWINSILSGSKNNHLSLVSDQSTNVVSINTLASFPEWLDKTDENLVKAIDHYKAIKNNNQLENPIAWRHAYVNEKIEFTLITLTQIHERVIINLFKGIISFIDSKESLRKKMNELDSQFRLEDSLGGIGKFIFLIQDKKSRNMQIIKDLIKSLNQLDSEFNFGKILTKINRSGDNIYSSFQNFRSIDNLLSHKGRETQSFTKSDADWLFSYVTRDFRGLYDCFK